MATRSSKGRKTSSRKRKVTAEEGQIYSDISVLLLFALSVILFLCNFHIIGAVGDFISSIMFGLFGILAYITPIAAFVGFAFLHINPNNKIAKRKFTTSIVLYVLISILSDYLCKAYSYEEYNLVTIYTICSESRTGGGIIAGSLAFALYKLLDIVGAMIIVFVAALICVIILSGKSISKGMKAGKDKVSALNKADEGRRISAAEERYARMETSRANREAKKLQREEERRLREEGRLQKIEEERLRQEELETQRILRMDKKVSGVTVNTSLSNDENYEKEDVHEIIFNEADNQLPDTESAFPSDFEKIKIHTGGQINIYGVEEESPDNQNYDDSYVNDYQDEYADNYDEEIIPVDTHEDYIVAPERTGKASGVTVREKPQATIAPKEEPMKKKANKPYKFPPMNLLNKGKSSGGASANELKTTAAKLQETLATFGVHVTITDISQGPAVTRYEMQPEMGVKVSKIVSLTDDIKLNLAATDIRIEAPIPGKAAIGIEVPNKENSAVCLRDMLETKDFKDFKSKICFGAGKDISGKPVIADIAKMPHVLIAGATGSGKSVCINTIIMSILYKSSPDDVKLILIDPKVVELSVYNGIPHLLIPVVTDPKKAAAALQWGVSEMMDRYKKFAEEEVRDLASYNKKAESDGFDKLPQMVIIVDELADLMMVAAGEVEEAICRLAQLARAAGIHLILATQRPSVDVITGLIKANMPSRIAFSVSSGVDSRTILDMVGAEKLLGKGDMLFYPQNFTKPARLQGAFVSDDEVKNVVDYLKAQVDGDPYDEEAKRHLENPSSSGGNSSGGGFSAPEQDNGYDPLFYEAGRSIIDKQKASIGMLQRLHKIGFNRAARIMDQLADAGVVGPEEGTKPRAVLMNLEQFEDFIKENNS